MGLDIKSILRKPKFMLPLLSMPFVFFLVYQFGSFGDIDEQDNGLEQKNELNMNIQDANTEKIQTQRKLESVARDYKDIMDETLIQNIQDETADDSSHINKESVYSDSERDSLFTRDSTLAALIEEQRKAIENVQKSLEEPEEEEEPAPQESVEDIIKRQMRLYDSLSNPEAYLQKPTHEVMPSTLIKKEDSIQKVVREDNYEKRFFNTIKTDEKQAPITAILDETVKTVDGSRIKIRLLDNVKVGDVKLPQGTYLYGNVTGFTAQRVKITVSSVLVKDKIIKVSLSVYDNDGQEGFFVPQSTFREVTKDAGGNIAGQSVAVNDDMDDSGMAQKFAWQALQNLYNSTSSAIGNSIRKNRAKLKYGSHIYLINNDEQ